MLEIVGESLGVGMRYSLDGGGSGEAMELRCEVVELLFQQ